jgi:CRISPR-associated protein Cas2
MTQWLVEVHPGVFVGRPSALVRDRLWKHVQKAPRLEGAVLIHSSSEEPGFRILSYKATKRAFEDIEGLFLSRRP